MEYRDINTKGVRPQYDKVIEMLRRDDFASAEVKKIAEQKLYRAKLDYANRLLFKIGQYNGKRYALILEVIHGHAYERARFLNGAMVDELRLEDLLNQQLVEKAEAISYVNEKSGVFNVLDKIIAFDPVQDDIYSLPLPLIIIGSAGSGKTALTLEKLKLVSGDILYVTLSEYLARTSRNLYYSCRYDNEKQHIDFLSFKRIYRNH